MQKLLIADSSAVFTTALETALSAHFSVKTCCDGRTALELLSQYQPDALILNLQLPYLDGLSVLQNTSFHPPVILAVTTYTSVYIEQSVVAFGVDYTMVAPSVGAVAARLQDIMRCCTVPRFPADAGEAAVHHLRRLNIPSHLDGYHQLCAAIPMFAGNPRQLLTKELYPAVAEVCCRGDARAVEHSIRKAIRAGWAKKDVAVWRKYFPFGPRGRIACPTNKEFISRLAELLRTGSAAY